MVPERNSQSLGKSPMGHEKDGDAECEDMRWNDSHGGECDMIGLMDTL